jgi:hypothetical protein
MEMVKLLFEIEEDLKEQFKEQCRLDKKTMSKTIRDNIYKYIYDGKDLDLEVRNKMILAVKTNIEDAGKLIGENKVTGNYDGIKMERITEILRNAYRLIEKIEKI